MGDAKFLDGDSIRLLGGGFRLLGGGYDGQSGGGGPPTYGFDANCRHGCCYPTLLGRCLSCCAN